MALARKMAAARNTIIKGTDIELNYSMVRSLFCAGVGEKGHSRMYPSL